jgi:DNA polymerase-3 subunit delta'
MPFHTVAGHRPLLELLARTTAGGTLPPSLIFAGPEGVGKRLTATALAQALNCERVVVFPKTGASPIFGGKDACGDCPACQRIARGVHADVLLVEPVGSGAIKIDQIREAIDRSAYRPFEGRRRVVIIDCADALVSEAQNALLKTLEEPPAASVFVLITARPDLLLPTVRSRCHQLRFGALAPGDVAAALIRDHGFAPGDAHAAAAASGGSIGRALEESAEETVEARAAAAALLQSLAGSRDPRRRLEGAKALAGSGDRDEIARRLLALASLIRDIGVLSVRADEATLANADLKSELHHLGRAFDSDRAVRAFAAVDRAIWALDRNASPKIVADWVALQI